MCHLSTFRVCDGNTILKPTKNKKQNKTKQLTCDQGCRFERVGHPGQCGLNKILFQIQRNQKTFCAKDRN